MKTFDMLVAESVACCQASMGCAMGSDTLCPFGEKSCHDITIEDWDYILTNRPEVLEHIEYLEATND